MPTERAPIPTRAWRDTTRWLVYMLRCRDGSLYTGITNDLTRRLAAHAAGTGSRYTRSRLPVRLVYREFQPTRSQALRREAALKKLSRHQKLRLVTAAGQEDSRAAGCTRR